MAFVKLCDNDGKVLSGDSPFVSIKGSITDQIEREDGTVEFRYLTDSETRDEYRTFCSDGCEMEWRRKRRTIRKFRKP